MCRFSRRDFDSLVNLCWLVGCLLACILWHINLGRLFNAKSIFIPIIGSILNNSI